MGQAQGCGGEKKGGWCGIAAAGKNIDHNRRRVDALIERFATGGLDGLQTIIGHAAQDLNHLSIAIVAALQLAPDRGHRRRQHPVLERGSVTQCPGFACQNRHIVPWIIDSLAAAKGARMFADDGAVLANDDPISRGMHFDRTTDCSRQNRVFVAVKPHGAGL